MSGIVTSHILLDNGHMIRLSNNVLDGWTTVVELPFDAKVIAVGAIRDVPALWVVGGVGGNPSHLSEKREFLVIADGVQPPDGIFLGEGNHVGSITPGPGASHAWHVFELARARRA